MLLGWAGLTLGCSPLGPGRIRIGDGTLGGPAAGGPPAAVLKGAPEGNLVPANRFLIMLMSTYIL